MSASPAGSDLIERIRAALPGDKPIYLVGGAVRDFLLGRPTHDMDFVLGGEVLSVARQVANSLGGAYYPLDVERETGRVILVEGGDRQILDFAAFRGPDLESDLRLRDFTINALAVPLFPLSGTPPAGEQAGDWSGFPLRENLIDPLGGLQDLREGSLRACSDQAFTNDPLRILRGVRLAAAFKFHILPETRAWMKAAVSKLSRVSPERVRDEFFHILGGPQPAAALRSLDLLGVLDQILPELTALKGVTQSPPHVYDVWDHTLDVVQRLGRVLSALSSQYDERSSASLAMGELSLRLGRFRGEISAHLQTAFTPERSLKPLLFFAALYHDSGKPAVRKVEPGGRIRFFGHDISGAEIAARRAHQLHLSRAEIDRVSTIIRHHLRPKLLSQAGGKPSRRAVYRFFRDTGPAGVDICLLSLADELGTYGPALPHDEWAQHVEVVRALLESWWEKSSQEVDPSSLIGGDDLMEVLEISPGPVVGRLLEEIREAQAAGEVATREEALALAAERLEEWQKSGGDQG